MVDKEIQKEMMKLKRLKQDLKRLLRDTGRSNIIYKKDIQKIVDESE